MNRIKIEKIDDIQSWESIKKCIPFFDFSEEQFIILRQINQNKYCLLDKLEFELYKYKSSNCFLIPKKCLSSIDYFINPYNINRHSDILLNNFNFKKIPEYHFIQYLYKYRNNSDICLLILFSIVSYHICKNNDYYLFSKFNNYNDMFLCNLLNRILDVCNKELDKSIDLDIYTLKGSARKHIAPVDNIQSIYHFITKDIDCLNINCIIEFIFLLIVHMVYENYFVAVYDMNENQNRVLLDLLKNM